MAKDDGGAGGGGGRRGAAAARPTLALPPRSAIDAIFRPGGAAAEASPGPMTLVSRFFADDPDSECHSFSQLLAGAIGSPAAAPRAGKLEQGRPAGLSVAPSPFFTVPPGFSPAGLLESPGFFPSGLGQFGISHQQALAQVTAQAAQSSSRMHIQAEYPSISEGTAASLPQPASSTMTLEPVQHLPHPASDTDNAAQENIDGYHSDQRSQPTAPVVNKPADDGYNWRKYGQKQVKGSEYPRSYYKCTQPKCPVKKKVERSLDGQVTEIIYKGEHNHQRPPCNKHAKESGGLQNISNELTRNVESGSQVHHESSVTPFISKREREMGYGTPERSSGSSDGEEMDGPEMRMDEVDDGEHDPKRRNMDNRVIESTSHRTVTEPRIIVQTTSEVDLLDDGYKWRKYGQKVVKGNPNPRSYYKCTNMGCNVRKHVERASTDPKAVITTYEGKHNHDVPTARNSSHNSAIVRPKVQNAIFNNQAFHRGTGTRHNGQQPAVLELKEEHDIT